MSAATEISDLLEKLRKLSSTYRGLTSTLIREADQAVSHLKNPEAVDIKYDVIRDDTTIIRLPKPPSILNINSPTMPTLGGLQELLEVNDTFSGKKPKLKLPKFSYPTLGKAPKFSSQSPNILPLTVNPTVPDLGEITLPNTTEPETIIVDSINKTIPDVPKPTFKEFNKDFFAEYESGLNLMGNFFNEWSAYLNEIRDMLLPMQEVFQKRLKGILNGTEPGLPDSWESQSYDQARQAAYEQRYEKLDDIDSGPGTVTGLPSGRRGYSELQLELTIARSVMQSSVKVANARQQREVKHLEWALRLMPAVVETILQLRLQEASWKLKGFLLALEGANETLNLAMQVLKFKEREFDMIIRYNDTQLRRTEDAIKIEKTKLEKLLIQVSNNKLKAAYNQNQARLDEIASKIIENKINLFQGQVEYLVADQEWRKLVILGFDAEIQAYTASVNAAKAEQSALQAKIKGDLAKADGELASVKLYEAEMLVKQAEAKAASVKAQARASQMKQLLGSYNTSVSAQLQWLKEVDAYNSLALRAMTKGFDAELEEKELELANQKLLDQEALNTAKNTMIEDQLELLKKLQIHSVTLMKDKSQGTVMAQGAATLGAIAHAAFAGLNAVGTTVVKAEV